jgi:hypothetical protein
MAKVSNLKIAQQSGGSEYYASWDFNLPTTTTTTTTSSTIKAGSIVSIKSGATYYNGVAIPSYVKSRKWKVKSVSGDRAVLGGSTDGEYADINSPINVKYLTGDTTSSSTTTTVPANTLDHYEVKWYYTTGATYSNGSTIWFDGSSENVTARNSRYSPPGTATAIYVSVKPVSKKYKSGNTEKSYWTGTAVTCRYWLSGDTPDVPPVPSVTIDQFTLTAEVNNIEDYKTDQIEFQVYDGTKKVSSGVVTVQTKRAVYTCSISAGGNYRVQCRAINNTHTLGDIKSDWSGFSGEESTIPSSVTGISCKAESETSVKVTWNAVDTATSYEVQYATKKAYFDSSSEAGSMIVNTNTAIVTGLSGGNEWFFRVRAKNAQGDSGWSAIVSTVIGTVPEAPTTWSLTNTVIVGEDVILYWVHNCEDGSNMTESEIELTIGGNTTVETIPGTVDQEEEEEPIYSHTIKTSGYSEGTEIQWRVRTKGVVAEYGEWSVKRVVKVYAPPTLSLTAVESGVLESFPLDVLAEAGPTTQSAISFYISIVAKTTYETEDFVGRPVTILSGTELYSKVFNASGYTFDISLSAGDLLLENGQFYELTVRVAMNSGLTAEERRTFEVSWEDYTHFPEASIAIDKETLSAYITPFCVTLDSAYAEDVTLAVYRREADGKFTEIAKGLANSGVHTVTDSHPSLDYARYRIVAQHIGTGSISFEDLPGEPVGEPSIVIQWDEDWVDFNHEIEDEPETKPWVGSMVRLPYNVDIHPKYDADVSLVEYIGREHPVSYYGTQTGETATWSTDIIKADKETIYALRRLAAWKGDVYVREPTGTGYWAHIKVDFPINHRELVVPVTFDITRVEGGI